MKAGKGVGWLLSCSSWPQEETREEQNNTQSQNWDSSSFEECHKSKYVLPCCVTIEIMHQKLLLLSIFVKYLITYISLNTGLERIVSDNFE